MRIQDKFLTMDLDQLSKFLQKPIGVTFKKKGLQGPRITWIKYGYQGDISLQDLAKRIWDTYKKDQKELKEKPINPLQERAVRYYQIEKGRDLIKVIRVIETSIQKMWWNHSYISPIGVTIDKLRQRRGAGQALDELLDSFAVFLDAEQRKLDRESSKFHARYVFNQYANLFNDIFSSFSFSFHPHDFAAPQQARQPSFNPYHVLGLPIEATASEIKKKYHQLALKIHPDKNPDDPQAPTKFQELQKAYEILSHPDKRSRYDRFGVAG